MTVLHDYNGLERYVLFQLNALSEPSGSDLGDALDALYSSGVNQSRIYQILRRLQRHGLAEVRDKDGRTNIYDVTADGREALREYHEWTAECASED